MHTAYTRNAVFLVRDTAAYKSRGMPEGHTVGDVCGGGCGYTPTPDPSSLNPDTHAISKASGGQIQRDEHYSSSDKRGGGSERLCRVLQGGGGVWRVCSQPQCSRRVIVPSCATLVRFSQPLREAPRCKNMHGSALVGFTSCIVKYFRSRRSFISSPLWTP